MSGVQFDGHASASQMEVDSALGVPIEGTDHINTVFELTCSCGAAQHFIHGYQWQNPDYGDAKVFLSPLILECAACGKKTDLFDSDIHGSDAEHGYGSSTVRGEGEKKLYTCDKCGQQPFRIFT